MDVAKNIRNPRLVEQNIPCTARLIKSQVEGLSFEERKYVVKKWIPVRKFDLRAHRNDQYMRLEALIFLRQPGMLRRLRRNCRRQAFNWSEPKNNVARV